MGIVTLVSWLAAPEWLTLDEASSLSGHDAPTLRRLVADGSLISRGDGQQLIEKRSLRDYQEALLDVAASLA